jgi:hypothetical protein
MASRSCKKSRSGELGIEREKDLSAEREGKGFPDRRQPSPCCRRSTPARVLSNGERGRASWWRGPGVRESGEGANGRQERVPERVSGFIHRDRLGLGCSSIGRDWASQAALWGGIVH